MDYKTVYAYQKMIQHVVQKNNDPFLLLLDTQWPSIRLGGFEWVLLLKKWEKLKLVVDEKLADYHHNILFCDYPFLIDDVAVWDIVKIDSGRFDVKVLSKTDDYLLVEGLSDISLKPRKHVNLPGVKLKLLAISSRDRADLEFAVKNNFGYVALSFVSCEDDVMQVRDILDRAWWREIKIISKIENASAIESLDAIVRYSDMLMVARGDLWVELPYEKVPVFQREIIGTSQKYQKPVIVATEMLESMIEDTIPTRAEVSDVFDAVLQWVDYVMLSAETAIGKYPVKTVETMKKIISEAELYIKSVV